MDEQRKGWVNFEVYFIVIQWLSHVWLFATPWTASYQDSLSFTISQSLLKLMSIESMMPSNHLILFHPFPPALNLSLLPSIFPSIRVFPMSQLFASRGQSIRASASVAVLPMNIQGWFLLGFTIYILFRRRQRQPTPVLLPGKSPRRRSLVGCSPWGR